MKIWLVLLLTVASACGADFSPRYSGLRFGASATSIDDLYTEVDIVLRWELHRPLDLGKGWRGITDLDFALGPLNGRGNTGLIGSLGPLFEVGRDGFPLRFAVGISPTLLSLQEYDQDDFGSPLQLTSHAGFSVTLGRDWSLGYRFQHMSNAHLDDSNPGLNLHALTVMVKL
jgi:hypothetical protein